ncbi:MAG: repeat containing protein [Flavipsychrobacter sp.]|nr:repeat containing protein [Flavipsychrobacter sp.]
MRKPLLIVLFTCACIFTQAQVNIITTICGTTVGYCGDGGPAKNACLNNANLLCLDNFDNLYLSDAFNNRIRKISLATGIITTVAGKGTVPGTYSGDGGPATNAELFIPDAVYTDSAGNIYIADGLNYRIRKVDIVSSIISTVAGNGTKGDSGDGGPATNAKIGGVSGLYIGKNGDIIFTDLDNNEVKKVDGSTGVLTTLAGKGMSGYSGDNGLAVNAILASPGQPFLDDLGNIFFTEYDNNIVRKITTSTGIITTIAGNGTQGCLGDGGPSTSAKLNRPYGIFIDPSRNIFIGDWGNGSIRKINSLTGIITTVAGEGVQGFSGDGGPATAARLAPDGIWIDRHGRMFIADEGNNVIRMVQDTTQDYTEVKLVTKNSIKIYPNPASNELTIEGAEGSKVSVWNMVGQEVLHMDKIKASQVINISHLVQGIYLVSAINPETGNKTISRIVKSE